MIVYILKWEENSFTEDLFADKEEAINNLKRMQESYSHNKNYEASPIMYDVDLCHARCTITYKPTGGKQNLCITDKKVR